MWREIGVCVLSLTVVLIFGQVWFHLVEGFLFKIKSMLNRGKRSFGWHTFEETEENKSR